MLEFIRRIIYLFKKKSKYRYFTKGGYYAKITGEYQYLKSWIDKKELRLMEAIVVLEHNTAIEIMHTWKEITEANYLKQFEIMNNPVKHQGERPCTFVTESGGRNFYTFVNNADIPIGRYREMEVILMEYESRADKDYILKAFSTIKEKLDNNKDGIKVSDIATICSDAIGRMTLLFDFSLYEKIASVMYFDEAEDISIYDFAYNEKKIAHWREHGGVDFFLKLPIKTILPLQMQSEVASKAFLQANLVKLKMIHDTLARLSKKS